MLSTQNLCKTFTLEKGQVRAVQGVTFKVEEGEFFALLGPSGSGKSTTLRCVAGLEKPEKGEITIGDKVVFSSEKRVNVPPNERPIGMVFQSYAIWPHMSVGQNVAFPLQHGKHRLSRERRRQAVAEALDTVRLGGFDNRPATQLSGGQQQRVALARALVTKPQVLLLDEPLSNLDAKLREEMRHEIRELTRSLNITTFYVTHDQIEALSMADKVGVIMDGILLEVAPPLQMYKSPQTRMVAQFVGSTNLLEGVMVECQHKVGKVRTELGVLDVSLPMPLEDGAKVAVMVRPEAVICHHEHRDLPNLFEGVVEEALFLGTFISAKIKVNERSIRALLDYKNPVQEGDKVYVHFPCEDCVAMK